MERLSKGWFAVPAVRNFAVYSAVAVLVNAALQVTIFVSAMAIDLRRIEASAAATPSFWTRLD